MKALKLKWPETRGLENAVFWHAHNSAIAEEREAARKVLDWLTEFHDESILNETIIITADRRETEND